MSDPSRIERPTLQLDLTAPRDNIDPKLVSERVAAVRSGPVPKQIDRDYFHTLHGDVYRDLVLKAGSTRGTLFTRYAPDGAAIEERQATDVLKKLELRETVIFQQFNQNASLRTASKDKFVDALARLDDALVTTNSFANGTATVAALLTEQAAKYHGWELNMFRTDGSPLQPIGGGQSSRLIALRNEMRQSAIPMRARAFEHAMGPGGDRAAAERQYPELRVAIAHVKSAEFGRDAGDPHVSRRIASIQTELNAGSIPQRPEPTLGRAGGRDFQLSI